MSVVRTVRRRWREHYVSVSLKPAGVGGVIALVALVLYAVRLDRVPLQPAETALARQAYAVAQTGRDLDGRLLPLFVHGDAEVWFPPMPAWSAIASTTLVPTSPVAVRWPSVVFGALTSVAGYRVALMFFGNSPLAVLAATLMLFSPALYLSSRFAFDGVFALPFVLVAIAEVLRDRAGSTGLAGSSRSALMAGLSLGIGFYASTTAPMLMPIYLALLALVISADGGRSPAVIGRLALAFVLPLLFLIPWFVVHPDSYPDTLGRWALHAAHIRNPMDGVRAALNWGSLTNRASVYWEFLNPAYLFFPAEQNGALESTVAGPLAFPLLILIPIGFARIARTQTRAINVLLIVGLLVAPLAAGTFGENHAIGRALIIVPFACLIAAFGVESLWMSGRLARAAVVALLIIAVAQFGIIHGHHVVR